MAVVASASRLQIKPVEASSMSCETAWRRGLHLSPGFERRMPRCASASGIFGAIKGKAGAFHDVGNKLVSEFRYEHQPQGLCPKVIESS